MNLPLPKECHQQWLDMNPVEGGRICGGCQKKIFDMSRMSWTEIEELQKKNNYSVCGMYSDKQIQHWGKDISQKKKSFSARMIMASFLFYLSSTPAESCEVKTETYTQIFPEKSENKPAAIVSDTVKRTIVSGKIITKNEAGQEIIVNNVTIGLDGTSFLTAVPSGKPFSIDITAYIDSVKKPVLTFIAKGYLYTTAPLNPEQFGTNMELTIELDRIDIVVFRVKKPNLFQRIFRGKMYRKINQPKKHRK